MNPRWVWGLGASPPPLGCSSGLPPPTLSSVLRELRSLAQDHRVLRVESLNPRTLTAEPQLTLLAVQTFGESECYGSEGLWRGVTTPFSSRGN